MNHITTFVGLDVHKSSISIAFASAIIGQEPQFVKKITSDALKLAEGRRVVPSSAFPLERYTKTTNRLWAFGSIREPRTERAPSGSQQVITNSDRSQESPKPFP